MYVKTIRVWAVLCLILFLGEMNAQQGRSSQLSMPKIPLLKPEVETCSKSKVKPPLLVNNIVIMIDPGHGGHDVGTQSISKPRYQEKSLNLTTAKFVKEFLQQLGYKVIMTREEDKFISLDKRADMANTLQPTIFVSIHYNSAPSSEARGIEVFYYFSKDEKDRMAKSKRLAQSILKHVVAETNAHSRGVKHGNFLVIRETNVPAVLIEGGFVTNAAEMESLKDPVYLKCLAWGIVCGIEDYLIRLSSSSHDTHK